MAAHLLRKLANNAPVWLIRILSNLWLPYLGSGIRIIEISKDFRYVKVCLKRSWYNMNYVGTQFGGSIYATTDPFYMLQLINNLGPGYIVWDKAAHVDFKKPGKSTLYAEFRIDQKLIDEVIAKTSNLEKYIFDLPVEVKDSEGKLIALINKTLYVRKK